MQKNIGIGMPLQTIDVRNFNSTQMQYSADLETVRIVTETYTHF